jgi:hypothetical protein
MRFLRPGTGYLVSHLPRTAVRGALLIRTYVRTRLRRGEKETPEAVPYPKEGEDENGSFC